MMFTRECSFQRAQRSSRTSGAVDIIAEKVDKVLIITYRAMMRAEEYDDPLAFRPERFLGENPPTDPHVYAFGFGRRCV